jgi:GT2 family glycosyltransferase
VASGARARVSVVVPFKGDASAARRLLDALEAINTIDGDELIAIDNTNDGTLAAEATGRRVQVTRATDQASSYYARNVGAERARNPWILFTDADCKPFPTILDDYFERPLDERCGAISGEVVGMEDQDHVVARYARARGHINQAGHIASTVRPFASTANLLVRREAWLDVGGFCEGIRTAGDQDFVWRLQDRGWTLDYAPNALAFHAHRETVRGLIEQWTRYGTATAWLGRRYPGTYARSPLLRSLAGAGLVLARAVGPLLRGRREDAAFRALDAVVAAASAVGAVLDNRARTKLDARPRLVVLAGTYPDDSVPPSAATHVEAERRADVPNPWLFRATATCYAEDDGPAHRMFDLAWLCLRHPLRTMSTARADGALHQLCALAPTARRLIRAVMRGASWRLANGRSSDGTRIQRLLGVPPVPEQKM